jgi:hypothetical protein
MIFTNSTIFKKYGFQSLKTTTITQKAVMVIVCWVIETNFSFSAVKFTSKFPFIPFFFPFFAYFLFLREFISLTAEMSIFNLLTCNFESPISPVESLCPRSHSSYCQLGRYFILHGGIDVKRRVLNDLWMFDMLHMSWIRSKYRVFICCVII